MDALGQALSEGYMDDKPDAADDDSSDSSIIDDDAMSDGAATSMAVRVTKDSTPGNTHTPGNKPVAPGRLVQTSVRAMEAESEESADETPNRTNTKEPVSKHTSTWSKSSASAGPPPNKKRATQRDHSLPAPSRPYRTATDKGVQHRRASDTAVDNAAAMEESQDAERSAEAIKLANQQVQKHASSVESRYIDALKRLGLFATEDIVVSKNLAIAVVRHYGKLHWGYDAQRVAAESEFVIALDASRVGSNQLILDGKCDPSGAQHINHGKLAQAILTVLYDANDNPHIYTTLKPNQRIPKDTEILIDYDPGNAQHNFGTDAIVVELPTALAAALNSPPSIIPRVSQHKTNIARRYASLGDSASAFQSVANVLRYLFHHRPEVLANCYNQSAGVGISVYLCRDPCWENLRRLVSGELRVDSSAIAAADLESLGAFLGQIESGVYFNSATAIIGGSVYDWLPFGFTDNKYYNFFVRFLPMVVPSPVQAAHPTTKAMRDASTSMVALLRAEILWSGEKHGMEFGSYLDYNSPNGHNVLSREQRAIAQQLGFRNTLEAFIAQLTANGHGDLIDSGGAEVLRCLPVLGALLNGEPVGADHSQRRNPAKIPAGNAVLVDNRGLVKFCVPNAPPVVGFVLSTTAIPSTYMLAVTPLELALSANSARAIVCAVQWSKSAETCLPLDSLVLTALQKVRSAHVDLRREGELTLAKVYTCNIQRCNTSSNSQPLIHSHTLTPAMVRELLEHYTRSSVKPLIDIDGGVSHAGALGNRFLNMASALSALQKQHRADESPDPVVRARRALELQTDLAKFGMLLQGNADVLIGQHQQALGDGTFCHSDCCPGNKRDDVEQCTSCLRRYHCTSPCRIPGRRSNGNMICGHCTSSANRSAAAGVASTRACSGSGNAAFDASETEPLPVQAQQLAQFLYDQATAAKACTVKSNCGLCLPEPLLQLTEEQVKDGSFAAVILESRKRFLNDVKELTTLNPLAQMSFALIGQNYHDDVDQAIARSIKPVVIGSPYDEIVLNILLACQKLFFFPGQRVVWDGGKCTATIAIDTTDPWVTRGVPLALYSGFLCKSQNISPEDADADYVLDLINTGPDNPRTGLTIRLTDPDDKTGRKWSSIAALYSGTPSNDTPTARLQTILHSTAHVILPVIVATENLFAITDQDGKIVGMPEVGWPYGANYCQQQIRMFQRLRRSEEPTDWVDKLCLDQAADDGSTIQTSYLSTREQNLEGQQSYYQLCLRLRVPDGNVFDKFGTLVHCTTLDKLFKFSDNGCYRVVPTLSIYNKTVLIARKRLSRTVQGQYIEYLVQNCLRCLQHFFF